MNPLHEHLNEQLERQQGHVLDKSALYHLLPRRGTRKGSPLPNLRSGEEQGDRKGSPLPNLRSGEEPTNWSQPSNYDPEVDALVTLAHRLQAAPPLQVDPNFAWQLERRILARNVALRQRRSASTWLDRLFPRSELVRPIFGVALILCILVLLGTSILVGAAQVSNPNNPLYGVKRWEQHVRLSLGGSTADRVELDLQIARDRLNALAELADPAHAEAYRQGLVDLDQQINNATQAINALPAEPARDRLSSELATLKADARHTLRGFLFRLALPERLATTDELGRLGDKVPHLYSTEVVLSSRPSGQATINITGDNIQPGAQLLVNGRQVQASGSLHNGVYVFVANWTGNQHPHSIAIQNPDGTVVQTTAIALKISGGAGGGNGGGKGNGNGGGKPGITPTPHH